MKRFPQPELTRLRCWESEFHAANQGPPGCGDCLGEHASWICRARMAEHEPERLAQSKLSVEAQHREQERMVEERKRHGYR